MKKFLLLLTVAFTSLTPIASINAQSMPEGPVWEALGKVASLENAKSLESIYGNFEIDQLEVNYRISLSNLMNNSKELFSASKVTAQLNIINKGDATEYVAPFKSLVVNLNGELISANEKDLYLKLTDLTFNLQGADQNMQSEIDYANTVINLVKGNWYHVPLDEFYGQGLGNLAYKPFLNDFKDNSKQAFKELIKEMVVQQVKQEQYYSAMFGDYEAMAETEVKILDVPINADYSTYMNDEVRQHPIDLPGLVEKGVLECDGTLYSEEGLQNGFQYPSCWPSISFTGKMTPQEEKLAEELYANNGEWVFENNQWYYVDFYPNEATEDHTSLYQNAVSPEDFKYDQKAIDEEVKKIMVGVDFVLETQFFNQREIISGTNEGFSFYSLNRPVTLEAMKNFAKITGDEINSSDEGEIKNTLAKINLAGIYRIREDNGVMDNFFARFKFNDESFLKNFELNYRFKLTDWETENKIQIPTKVTELDNLDELIM